MEVTTPLWLVGEEKSGKRKRRSLLKLRNLEERTQKDQASEEDTLARRCLGPGEALARLMGQVEPILPVHQLTCELLPPYLHFLYRLSQGGCLATSRRDALVCWD